MSHARTAFVVLSLFLAGCQSTGGLPDSDWISVEGAGSLHPQSDPRRMHVVAFESTPEGDGLRLRVETPGGGPLEGVEVFSSLDLGPEVLVDRDSTPRSIAASVAASGEKHWRSSAALTDNYGVAVLRDSLFLSERTFFVVLEKEGYFQVAFERRGKGAQ